MRGTSLRGTSITGAGRLAMLALALAALLAPTARAATPVDPDQLIPPPPPGAKCWATGGGTTCHTTFLDLAENAPSVELPCGTLYETHRDERTGIRWYDADDRLVRRHVFAHLEGFSTLSPVGDGPYVSVRSDINWYDRYAIPGDESSAFTIIGGSDWTLRDERGGVLSKIAGHGTSDPEEPWHGLLHFPDDPAIAPKVCAALAD